MNALDVYTKRNIYDYLKRPDKKFDKEYNEERQKIRQYIRKDDLTTKKKMVVLLIGDIFYEWPIVFNN